MSINGDCCGCPSQITFINSGLTAVSYALSSTILGYGALMGASIGITVFPAITLILSTYGSIDFSRLSKKETWDSGLWTKTTIIYTIVLNLFLAMGVASSLGMSLPISGFFVISLLNYGLLTIGDLIYTRCCKK